jgi:hypothetical protein
MNKKIEISDDAVSLIVRLLGAHARMNRALIHRESLDVHKMPGKKYLADVMISEAAMLRILDQVQS